MVLEASKVVGDSAVDRSGVTGVDLFMATLLQAGLSGQVIGVTEGYVALGFLHTF